MFTILKGLIAIVIIAGVGTYVLYKSPSLRQTLYYKATGLDKQVAVFEDIRADLDKLKAEIKTTNNPEAGLLIAQVEANLALAEKLNTPSTATPLSTSALVLGASVGNSLSNAYQSAAAFTSGVATSFSSSIASSSQATTTCIVG
ncbi:MAG TPA: hypothetical protein VI953_02335 [Candidatus Paceibacterota bacterium]